MPSSLFPRANRGFMREIGFLQGKALLLALPLMLAAATRSPAQHTDRERGITEIVRASSPAVVLIVTFDASNNPVAQGSGFVISPDGKIATNHHVIEGAGSAIVKMTNGAFFKVDGVLAESVADDLAILKVSGTGLPSLRLGDASSVAVGQKVIAMGSPKGFEGTVSDGIVSARRGEKLGTALIQTTAPASEGNSGGPLLNLQGNVVGVLTLKFKGGENLNFAVPVNALRSLLASAGHVPLPLSGTKAATPKPPSEAPPSTATATDAPSMDSDPTPAPQWGYVLCPYGIVDVDVHTAPGSLQTVAHLQCGDFLIVLGKLEQSGITMYRIRTKAGEEGYAYGSFIGLTQTRSPGEVPYDELTKLQAALGLIDSSGYLAV